MTNKTLCPARLKSGKPCRNNGKPEYNGYCGIHKWISVSTSTGKEEGRNGRLTKLLTGGAALAVIVDKSVEYLPSVIEVLVKLSHLAFVSSEEDVWSHDYRQRYDPDEMKTHNLTPKTLSSHINFLVQNQAWQPLADSLSYDFDVQINSGNIPPKLLADIMKQKNAVLKELIALGYTPSAITADKPVFCRALE